MKKLIQYAFIAVGLTLSLQSCETKKVIINREVTTDNGKMLLGVQTIEQFSNAPYSDWYNDSYNDYQLDTETIALLKKKKFNSYQLTVFVGTWCEDSHREFPRLMKILDKLKYPKNKLTIIAVNRKKESPNGEEGIFNIQKVPTIIVKRYGKELGRIIETPSTGYIEKDLLEIVSKSDTSIKDMFKR